MDHLRSGNRGLAFLLEQQQVVFHPMVIVELACGNRKNSAGLLKLFNNMPTMKTASKSEGLYFREENKFMGRGVGCIDFHLLVSAIPTPLPLLWTGNHLLGKIALETDVQFSQI